MASVSLPLYLIRCSGLHGRYANRSQNVRGGAIALGHPLGATGARQIVTGLSECRRRKAKVLVSRNDLPKESSCSGHLSRYFHAYASCVNDIVRDLLTMFLLLQLTSMW